MATECDISLRILEQPNPKKANNKSGKASFVIDCFAGVPLVSFAAAMISRRIRKYQKFFGLRFHLRDLLVIAVIPEVGWSLTTLSPLNRDIL